MEFAVAGGVHIGKRRAGGDETLRIGDPFCGAEDFQELVAFAADASKNATFLENKRPRKKREKKKQKQDKASDQASLRDNFKDVADKNGGEQKNGGSPSVKREFYGQKQPNTRVEHGQKNIDAGEAKEFV